MGRAIMFIFCSIFFTLAPLNHHLYLSGQTEDWHDFFFQYQLLLQDEKYELAEKALNNRILDMESYIETLSPERREIGMQLIRAIGKGSAETARMDASQLQTFLETTSSTDYFGSINRILLDYKTSLSQGVSVDLYNQWEVVQPSLLTYYTSEQLLPVSELLFQLENEADEAALQRLESELAQLPEAVPPLNIEALLWMVVFVGGSILATLAYVAEKNYKAYAEEKRSHKSEIS